MWVVASYSFPCEAEEEDLRVWMGQSWVLGMERGRRVASPDIYPLCFPVKGQQLGDAVMWPSDGKAEAAGRQGLEWQQAEV